MIEKRATVSCEIPPVELLQPGDRVKTAGALPAVQSVLDQLKPDPLYTYALVNAMGYSEFYGANSNADWYGYNPHLDFNGLLHAWDGIGENVETDRMKGQAWPYGYPCFYNATVYAHHKNTDPQQLGFGDVRFVFANPAMKRVELLLRVHNEEAKKKGQYSILERLAAGERSDVSMGAKVPFDLASCCTDWDAVKKAWTTFDPKRHAHPGIAILEYHRKVKPIRGLAVTSREYCSCFRSNRNKVRGDGLKYFVYNDFPRFFDISFVYIGADRTARAMWHLGSTRPSHGQIPMSLFSGFTMGKVASIDKEINGTVEMVVRDESTTPEVRFDKMLGPRPAPEAIKGLLSSAASVGVVLTPREFQMIVEGPGAAFKPCFDPTIGGVDDSLAVDPSAVVQKLVDALIHLAPTRSSFAPYLAPRLLQDSDDLPSIAPRVDPGNTKLSALYNGYRLSVMEKIAELIPHAEYQLCPDPLAAKTANNAVAGLLLGVAPVLHLVAAHLRRKREEGAELGAVASFLADHPTFMSMATLGAAIRVAMLSEGVGILAGAAKLLGPKV